MRDFNLHARFGFNGTWFRQALMYLHNYQKQFFLEHSSDFVQGPIVHLLTAETG